MIQNARGTVTARVNGAQPNTSAVAALLRHHGGEAAFATLLELVRTCFPDTCTVQAIVREDHDERGWFRVVVEVTLPADTAPDTVQRQHRLFEEQFAEAVPDERGALFVVHPHLALAVANVRLNPDQSSAKG